MFEWLRQHQGKLQFGLRMTLAALASYALGEALGLAQTYWAVLSAVIVIQGSVGGSFKTGMNRLVSTVGGAVWGAAVSILIPHDGTLALGGALLAAIAPLAVVTGFRPDYRVAPVTAIIVLMGTVLMQANPVSSALSRVAEISLGSAIAVAVALFVLPARAHGLLAKAASKAVCAMADVVSMFGANPGAGADEEAIFEVQSRVRIAIAQTETRAGEAKVERANRLSDGPDPEPLTRTLRRLRHDLAMLGRALGAPFAPELRDRMQAPLSALLGAIAAWFEEAAKALAAGETAPSLQTVHAAEENYRAAVANSGQEALTYQAGSKDTPRIFALLFLFEQMVQNLEDLAARIAELADDADARAERKQSKGL